MEAILPFTISKRCVKLCVSTRVLIGTGGVWGKTNGWIYVGCHNCHTGYSVGAILQLHHDGSVSQIMADDIIQI